VPLFLLAFASLPALLPFAASAYTRTTMVRLIRIA
jgi:hypothetical protein